MDDNQLKNIFEDFKPALSDSSRFMSQLTRSMDATEFVKQQNRSLRKRSRVAIILSGAAGFICGLVLMFLLPWMTHVTNSLLIQISQFQAAPIAIAAEGSAIIPWIVIGTASTFTTLGVYRFISARPSLFRVLGRRASGLND